MKWIYWYIFNISALKTKKIVINRNSFYFLSFTSYIVSLLHKISLHVTSILPRQHQISIFFLTLAKQAILLILLHYKCQENIPYTFCLFSFFVQSLIIWLLVLCPIQTNIRIYKVYEKLYKCDMEKCVKPKKLSCDRQTSYYSVF